MKTVNYNEIDEFLAVQWTNLDSFLINNTNFIKYVSLKKYNQIILQIFLGISNYY